MANYRDRASDTRGRQSRFSDPSSNVNNQIKNNISLGNYTSINSAPPVEEYPVKITPPKTNQVNQGANGNSPKALTADLSGTGQGSNIKPNIPPSSFSSALGILPKPIKSFSKTAISKKPFEQVDDNVFTDLTPKQKVGAVVAGGISLASNIGQSVSSTGKNISNWYETGRRELPIGYTTESNTVAATQPGVSNIADINLSTLPATTTIDRTSFEAPKEDVAYSSLQQASQPYQQFSGKQQNYLPSEINNYRGLQNVALGRVVPQTIQGGLVNRTNQVGNVNTLSFTNERTGGTGSIQFSDGRTLSPEQMKSLQERLNYQNTDQAEANRIRDAQVVADRERSYDAYLRQKDLRDSMSNIPMTRFNQALRMQKEANDLEAAKITALGKVQEAQIKDQSLADYRQAETVRKDRQQALGEAMMGIKAIEEKEKSTGMPVSLKSAFSTMMSYPGSDLEITRRFLSSKLGADPQFNALKEAYDTGDEDTKNEIYRSLGFTRKEIDFADKAMITEY